MGDKTKIEWADASWNPIVAHMGNQRGWMCTKPSDGCKNCYAERLNRVYGNGLDYTFKNADAVEWKLANLDRPLRWKRPRRIFVESMSDLFHEKIPDEFIDQVFAVMATAKKHIFQVLTKRPERMQKYFAEPARPDLIYWAAYKFGYLGAMCGGTKAPIPIPNVWLGVSCENQPMADKRVPILFQIPAVVRWISAEPLLGPIDFTTVAAAKIAGGRFGQNILDKTYQHVDWIVVGGESGPGARPCDLTWVRDIVEQCRKAKVPCFVKQLGAKPFNSATVHLPVDIMFIKDSKGGNWNEWPKDLKMRKYPKC